MAEQEITIPPLPIQKRGTGIITGRSRPTASGLDAVTTKQLESVLLGQLTQLEVQQSQLQQQVVSSFTQAQVAATQVQIAIFDGLVNEMRAKGLLNAETMKILVEFNAQANAIQTPRALVAADGAAMDKVAEILATLERTEDIDMQTVADQRAEEGATAYLAYKDTIEKRVGTVLSQGHSALREIADDGVRYNTAKEMEKAAQDNMRSMMIQSERGVTEGAFSEEDIDAAAERFTDEFFKPYLTGIFTEGDRLGRNARALAAADWKKKMDAQILALSRAGVSREALNRAIEHSKELDALIEGGPEAFAKKIGSVPVSETFDDTRRHLKASLASLYPEDEYTKGIYKMVAIPGFTTWATAMGFRTMEHAVLWASRPKNYYDFEAGLLLVQRPDLSTEHVIAAVKNVRERAEAEKAEIEARIGQFSREAGTSGRGKGLGRLPFGERVRGGIRGLAERMAERMEGVEGIEDVGGPFGVGDVEREDSAARRKREEAEAAMEGLDTVVDGDGPGFNDTGEDATAVPAHTLNEETGDVTVIERATEPGGDDYEYSINVLGDVHYRVPPSTDWIGPISPGGDQYNSIVMKAAHLLAQAGVKVPPAAYEAMKAVTPRGMRVDPDVVSTTPVPMPTPTKEDLGITTLETPATMPTVSREEVGVAPGTPEEALGRQMGARARESKPAATTPAATAVAQPPGMEEANARLQVYSTKLRNQEISQEEYNKEQQIWLKAFERAEDKAAAEQSAAELQGLVAEKATKAGEAATKAGAAYYGEAAEVGRDVKRKASGAASAIDYAIGMAPLAAQKQLLEWYESSKD